MLGIIKKDLFPFAINLIIIFPVLTMYVIYTGGVFNATVIIIMNILLYLLVLGPVLIIELGEEKNKGYDFLGQLPLKAFDVVAAKFLIPLAAAAVITVYYYLLFSWLSDSSTSLALEKRSVIICGTICLLTVGFTYIGTFAFGYMKFVRFGLVALLSLNVIFTIIFQRFTQSRLSIDISMPIQWLAELSIIYIIIFTLLAYFVLMLAAIKIRNRL